MTLEEMPLPLKRQTERLMFAETSRQREKEIN